jgi:hypothetical protein
MAAECGCIFNYPSCKCKTSDLNCCSVDRDCYTDCWKWQIMITREKFGSVLANSITELEFVLNDFTTTLSTPIYIAHLHKRTRSRCLPICKEMVLLYMKSSCYTLISCQATGHTVIAFFAPLGCIRRRQMRESPMSLSRFSGEDFFELSSVTRLPVEPLALRLVRFQEALREDNCRFYCPNYHWTPWQALVVFSGIGSAVVPLLGVHLGTCFISVFQSSSCMFYVVPVCYV